LRKKIEGVLNIAPFLSDVEVWVALLKEYNFGEVEFIMKQIREEQLDKLRNMSPKITVSGGKSLEEVIENTEKAKRKRIEGEESS
jgi:hypothetical protein